jgi:hypothetical protein
MESVRAGERITATISLPTISSCEVDVPYLGFLRRSPASLA